MAETIFSCPCGMILKVYGDDKAGSEITCPACQTTVIVPSTGQASAAPHQVSEVSPEPGASKVFAIVYLLLISIITLGLIRYLLLPALNRPEEVASTTVAEKARSEEPVETRPTKAAEKKARKRGRKDEGPIEPPSGSEVPVVKTGTMPEEPPLADFGSSAPATAPAEPTASTAPDPPPAARGEAPPEPPAQKAAAAPSSTDSSPYAHISNKEARKSLEYALMNTRHVKATWTADIFLKSAEKAADGDPVILNEVKKLRAKIDGLRKRDP